MKLYTQGASLTRGENQQCSFWLDKGFKVATSKRFLLGEGRGEDYARHVLRRCFATICIVLASCAPTEKSLRARGLSPLTQSELEALYSRTRTVRGTTAEGVTWTGTYTPDGVAKLDWRQGGDEGSWRITGGKFCAKFKVMYDGEERCFTIYNTGKNEFKGFNSKGSFVSTGTAAFTFTGGREELQF